MALAGSAAAILLLYVLFLAFTPSIKSRFDRYNRLNKIKLLYICATFFTLGMALPALIVLLATMHYCRNRRRICPNCHSKMHKLLEDEDNKYLTPAQDLEEQARIDRLRCVALRHVRRSRRVPIPQQAHHIQRMSAMPRPHIVS